MNFDQIISEMTLEEKALLLTGTGDMETAKLEKYGVPEKKLADGLMAFDIHEKKTAHIFLTFAALVPPGISVSPEKWETGSPKIAWSMM